MNSLGSIPEDFGFDDVWEVDLGTTLPGAVIGRRAQYDELIWDTDGGFAGNWVGRSSLGGDGTAGYTMLLARRAYSAAGLALFSLSGGGGGGSDTTLDGVTADLAGHTNGQVLGFVGGQIQPVAAGSASGWVTVVDVNLTTEATRAFVDGANTWNGVTWTGKNIATYADSFGIVNGTGLVMDTNALNSEWYISNDTYPALSARLVDLIPGYVPGATRVRVRAQWTLTNSDQNYEYSGFAIEETVFSTTSKRMHWGCIQGYDSGHTGGTGYDCAQRTIRAGSAYQRHSNVVRNAQMLDLDGLETARFYKGSVSAPDSDPNSTAIPLSLFSETALWTMSMQPAVGGEFTTAADADGRILPLVSAPADLCVRIGIQSGNTNNSFAATWKRLVVEYLKA